MPGPGPVLPLYTGCPLLCEDKATEQQRPASCPVMPRTCSHRDWRPGGEAGGESGTMNDSQARLAGAGLAVVWPPLRHISMAMRGRAAPVQIPANSRYSRGWRGYRG